MYKIKQIPEDFIVREISNVKIGKEGRYTYFLLKKRDYTTLRALERIAEKLRVPLKNLGFAGNKDKNALTEQICSVKGRNGLERIKLKDISVEYLGKGNLPISLGDLRGNRFEIVVRNIDKLPKKRLRFINFFGEQRFSKNNVEIGRAIVKRDFKKAVDLLAKSKGHAERHVEETLNKNQGNYILALRSVPKKLLKLYIHSYQALLWNKAAKKFAEGNKNTKIPLIGFGIESMDEIIKEILDKERLRPRDFIIKEIPELSSEGTYRNLFAEVYNLKIGNLEDDELNNEKKKIKIKFRLDKGCYATEFIRQLFA